MPTVPAMAGNERCENPPHLPALRQDALASAEKKMQAIQEIGQPEGKHACCMDPGTLQKSAKYWRKTPPSMPHSGHTMKEKPAPAATKRGKTIKFNCTTKEVNLMTAHDAPIPWKRG